MNNYKLINGNSLQVLKIFEENSIDSIVCDPPYELGFMGKSWDSTGIAFNKELWAECLRVLKPGGHLISFSGSRTYHRMAVAIEDAGFEIRDQIMWVYGSGFPKSLDVSKAIDKKAGAEREVIGKGKSGKTEIWNEEGTMGDFNITTPSTPQAKQWQGWGTALKPAHEPMVLARKPLSEKTVAENVLKWGTGAINIDECRVGDNGGTKKEKSEIKCSTESVGGYLNQQADLLVDGLGRWPANLIHDGLETELAKFFYCPKANKKDRNDGLDEFELKIGGGMNATVHGDSRTGHITVQQNNHPTVKPTDLMAYLVRLVTPPGGTVLDPFNGSGSTGKACAREGFNYVGIDLSQEYLDISKARIEYEISKKK